MHDFPDILGFVIKQARQKENITIESLAERVGVTDRYIYRIENEGQKPSYDILCKLIRTLSIEPNLIFYPEKPVIDTMAEDIIRLIYNCDERSLEVIKATAKALIGSVQEK